MEKLSTGQSGGRDRSPRQRIHRHIAAGSGRVEVRGAGVVMEVVLRLEFRLPNGEILKRDYGWVEASAKDHLMKKPPDWLDNPRKSWDHPQDPVVLRGDIKPGREEEARAAIARSSEPDPPPEGV